jgi:hypothetical protein
MDSHFFFFIFLKKSELEWMSDSIKKFTIEELIFILRDSYGKKILKL